MAKTTARPKSKSQRKRTRPPTLWERYRRPIVVAGIVLAAGLLVVTLNRGDKSGVSADEGGFTGGDFHSMVSDPTREAVLFAGGHQAVAVSIDGGKTWRQIATLENADAMGWAFTEKKVFVGGHPGISVSEDGGKTFERRNEGLPATDIHSLGAGTDVIYAGSPQVGFMASTDVGRTWEVRNARTGRSFMGRIVVDPNDSRHLFAPDMAGGVAESRDGGESWTDLGGVQGAMWVSLDSSDSRHLLVSGGEGAAESRDGGNTWNPMNLTASAAIAEFDFKNPNTIYAGTHDGERVTVRKSRDGGATWERP
jgi:photosystem II stability/assembly factor-like uncharacterized protein